MQESRKKLLEYDLEDAIIQIPVSGISMVGSLYDTPSPEKPKYPNSYKTDSEAFRLYFEAIGRDMWKVLEKSKKDFDSVLNSSGPTQHQFEQVCIPSRD